MRWLFHVIPGILQLAACCLLADSLVATKQQPSKPLRRGFKFAELHNLPYPLSRSTNHFHLLYNRHSSSCHIHILSKAQLQAIYLSLCLSVGLSVCLSLVGIFAYTCSSEPVRLRACVCISRRSFGKQLSAQQLNSRAGWLAGCLSTQPARKPSAIQRRQSAHPFILLRSSTPFAKSLETFRTKSDFKFKRERERDTNKFQKTTPTDSEQLSSCSKSLFCSTPRWKLQRNPVSRQEQQPLAGARPAFNATQ